MARYGHVFDILAEAGHYDVFIALYQAFFADGSHDREIFLLLLVNACQRRKFTNLVELIVRFPELRSRLEQLLAELPRILIEQVQGEHPVPPEKRTLRHQYEYRQVPYDLYAQMIYCYNRRSCVWPLTKNGSWEVYNKERTFSRARNLGPYYCTVLQCVLDYALE